jgi:hypothetical protein
MLHVYASVSFCSTLLPQVSAYDELDKLAALRDQGIVTEQEFQEQKKKLLGS